MTDDELAQQWETAVIASARLQLDAQIAMAKRQPRIQAANDETSTLSQEIMRRAGIDIPAASNGQPQRPQIVKG